MTIIRVTCSGGIAGAIRRGTVDTRTDPDGPRLRAFLQRRRGGRSAGTRRRGLPWDTGGADRLVYSFEIDRDRITVAEHELPGELVALVNRALAEH